MSADGRDENEAARLREKHHLHGTPTIGLTGATIGFFVGFAAVALFGTTAKKFESILDLSPLTIGILVAVPSLSGSLLRIPFGALTDRIGARIPMLTLLGISLVGMAGLTVLLYTAYHKGLGPSDLWLVLALGALSGAGIAGFSVGVNQTSYWSPRGAQGRALGLYAGLGNLAPGIFTLILPTALVVLGLAGAYLAWFILLAAGTLAYAIIARNAFWFQLRRQGVPPAEARQVAQRLGQEMFPSGNAKESLARSGANPRTWALVVLYFTSFGGFLALTAWLPTFWASRYGFTLLTAGILTAVGFALPSPLVRVGGGFLSDRVGGENTALLGFLILLVGAVTVAMNPGATGAIVGVILVGAGMGFSNAAVFQLVARYVPEAVGGASGWVGGVGAFGGFLLPPVLGAIVAAYGSPGYTLGFLVFGVLSLLSLVVAYLLRRRPSAAMAEAPGPHRKLPVGSG